MIQLVVHKAEGSYDPAKTGFLHIKKDIFSDLKDNLFDLLSKFRRKRCNADDAELRAINFCCAEDAQICAYKKTCCVGNPE